MNKRDFMHAVILLPTLPLLGCATKELPPSPPAPVVIDPAKISNFQELVGAIIKGAGRSVPKTINFDEIYTVLARAFVDRIDDAIKLGVEIPRKILDLLPAYKKTFVPIVPVGVATMMFTLYGVQYVIPIASFFKVVLGSVGVMFLFIKAIIDDKEKRSKEQNRQSLRYKDSVLTG